MQMLEYEGLRN